MKGGALPVETGRPFLSHSGTSIGFSVASGVLLALSLALPGAHWLAYIALTPLLIVLLVNPLSLPRSFLLGWLTGMIGYGVLFSYVILALSLPVFVLSLLYYSAYTGLFAIGVRFCSRPTIGLGSLIVPFLWSLLEYTRGLGTFGVPAGTLGATQAALLPVVQIVSLTGVFGLSGFVALVNVTLAQLALAARVHRYRAALNWVVATGTIWTSILVYGYMSLSQAPSEARTLTITAIQGDIDERGLDSVAVRQRIFDRYEVKTLAAKVLKPDLIVYPETMTGSYLVRDSLFLGFLKEMGSQTESSFLVGSRHLIRETDAYGLYNSAFAIDWKGRLIGRYDKTRLVPFGEYTPFGTRVPWLAQFRLSRAELTPGRSLIPLMLPDSLPVGVAICYEAMYGGTIRRQVLSGARLIAILSDDFWFQGTVASRQFFDEAILRAVENRTPVIRCANMGVSGVIDAWGRVVSLTGPVTGVTYGQVVLREAVSVYTDYGDSIVWLCGLASVSCLWTACRRRKTRFARGASIGNSA